MQKDLRRFLYFKKIKNSRKKICKEYSRNEKTIGNGKNMLKLCINGRLKQKR
jgi:hypothetical protein